MVKCRNFDQGKPWEDTFINFVCRNVSGMFSGVGVLLECWFNDVSVKMEIIDFIQLRIK